MKLHLLMVFALILSIGKAQTSLPNGNFENWDVKSYENLKFYQSSNKEVIRLKLTFNATRSADAYHGTSAIKLTTIANTKDTMFGYFVNSNPENDPSSWHGGAPYAQKPSGIRVHYKSSIPAGDTGLIIIAFSKAGVNIGSYVFNLYGQHSTYTLFTKSLSPALTQVPDSFVFAATSSFALGNGGGKVGSMLQLDSFSFTGVTSQPALLNGDFEEWETITEETPANWYPREQREYKSTKTNAAYKGQFGIVMESTLGENNGQPRNNSGAIGTGYYLQNCNNCKELGGYPYSNMLDTLVFWYKYMPVGNSEGAVYITMKKNGNNMWGNYITLPAAAAYTYFEIPLNPFQVPDTLIVDFESSRWSDSSLSCVGSVLIIDEVQLKSQPLHTGILKTLASSGMFFYPNPVADMLSIHLKNSTIKNICITDLQGKVLKSIKVNELNMAIDLSDLPSGVYLIGLQDSDQNMMYERISVQH